MVHAFLTRSLAVLLVLCILVIGGFASAQSITHESQHAHHQKAHHATVLCSWMCAAGQLWDTIAVPALGERSPAARVEPRTFQTIPTAFVFIVTSRGPPTLSA